MAFENNQYRVHLAFKNHSEVLPDRFNVARSRLISLKRKLNSNPPLLQEYDQITKDYLKAAFTLIYILTIYILLVHKVIYKWPHLYIKT